MSLDTEFEFTATAHEQESGFVRSDAPKHWLDANPQLKEALLYASECEQFIPYEHERIQKLNDEAKSNVEREARQFQKWYVEQHLRRSASLARERIDYFKSISTPEQIDAENEKCAQDKIHWFRMYAWGYDPRARSPISTVPFELFPKQAELVNWLDEIVFDKRTSGLVEKSRDEGATELFVRWSVHNWRYHGEGFSVLLSTRKDDEIDTKKKKGTLFERARFQIRLLPAWMLPEGFDVVTDLRPDKLIANPLNGNVIQGEAPVERMGSGDRVTCALFDEHAFWRFGGYPQFASMSQTTDSILMISSVGGKLNQYADIAFDGVTPKFVLDWHENPFKDVRWYNSLPYGYISPKMSKTTIAQEVDRNYEASQPGKVWQCPEQYVFITQSEFLRAFKDHKHKFFNEQNKFKIPDDWRVVRTSDYGKSDGHDWSYLLGAQPRANYPLNDTHFVFVGRNLEPTGIQTAEAVQQWREWEMLYGLRNKNGWTHAPYTSWNSHEQDELRKVLLQKYGESWRAWDTDYQTGIETVEEWWTPIDLLEQNPFRYELYGRCTLVFVAPDGEYTMAYNERLSTHFVTVSDSEAGFFTLRKQISAYHYPLSELGKAKKDMRPVKEFDDIVDALRGYAVNWNREPDALTKNEKAEAALPDHLKQVNIHAVEDRELAERLTLQRHVEFGKMDKVESRQRQTMNKYRPQVPKVGFRGSR